MAAAVVDININEGDTFKMSLDLWSDADNTLPIDLSTSTFEGQFKFGPSRVNMTIEVVVPNILNISVPYANMGMLPDTGKYDIDQIVVGDERYRLIQGNVKVNHEVTR